MPRDKHGYGKTGYDSHRHDPPWKDTDPSPEPNHVCESCGGGYDRPNQRTTEVDLTTLKVVRRCPHCDAIVSEQESDVTEGYLRAWREVPEEMHGTIESYAELRDLPDPSDS